MPQPFWQPRIARADSLTRIYPFAAEMLSFYIQVANLQQGQYRRWESASRAAPPEADLAEVARGFPSFLAQLEEVAPQNLRATVGELRRAGANAQSNLLTACWQRPELSPSQPEDFLARMFLQPYAILSRVRSGAEWPGYNRSACPFCSRKPGAGILRPRGDGGSRSLLCSFCLAEWDFRRIVCAGCGEEDYAKLPVYTAEDFDYIRVECCDTCKQYLKTIDLTKNGLADPVVDEIAAAPLDLWARERGYSKLEVNLVGM